MEWKYELHAWNPLKLYEFPLIQRHVLMSRLTQKVSGSHVVARLFLDSFLVGTDCCTKGPR